MDFYEDQQQAQNKTANLIGLFSLALVFVVAGLYGGTVGLLKFLGLWASLHPWWDVSIALLVAPTSVAVLGSHTWLKIKKLEEQGGAAIAASVGGRVLHHKSATEEETQLLNVVEEMSLASSLPVPWVYVLDREPGINAFTTGFHPGNAAIAVTKGALDGLSRDELQGMVAHEFSHIVHGDMHLNTSLIGLLSGLTAMTDVGNWLFRLPSRLWPSEDHGVLRFVMITIVVFMLFAPLFLYASGAYGTATLSLLWLLPGIIGGVLALVGAVGGFFSSLIQRAVAQQREYLADAAGVQFSRFPDGLAGVLRKIKKHPLGSRVLAPKAARASHCFFADPAAPSFLTPLLSSHPTHDERLERLQNPGQFLVRKPRGLQRPVGSSMDGAGRSEPIVSGRDVNIPAILYDHSQDRQGAIALIYGLLLDTQERILRHQLAVLDQEADPMVLQHLRDVLPTLRTLPPLSRIPLVKLTIPALRGLSSRQAVRFFSNLDQLAKADRRLSTFEFALFLLLKHGLLHDTARHSEKRQKIHDLRIVAPECALLLSTVAHLSVANETEAVRSFEVGRAHLPDGVRQIQLIPRQEIQHPAVAKAIERLDGTSISARRHILDACTYCIKADGVVKTEEAEFLNVLGILLHTSLS